MIGALSMIQWSGLHALHRNTICERERAPLDYQVQSRCSKWKATAEQHPDYGVFCRDR